MVRNYKRKTKDIWTKETLLEALHCIKDGELKINDCAKQYKISRATLYRHYGKFITFGGQKQYLELIRTCGGNPILTKVEEQVMKKTILDLRGQGYNVTSADIKRICFEYCDSNGIPNQFREDKRMASDDWYYGFLKRNPDLRISKPCSNTDDDDNDAGDDKSRKEKARSKKSQDALGNPKVAKKAGGRQRKPLKRLSKEKVQEKIPYYPSTDEVLHDIVKVKDEVDEDTVQEEEGTEPMNFEEVSEENCEMEADYDRDERVSEEEIDEHEACSDLEEMCESGPELDHGDSEPDCTEAGSDNEDVKEEVQTQKIKEEEVTDADEYERTEVARPEKMEESESSDEDDFEDAVTQVVGEDDMDTVDFVGDEEEEGDTGNEEDLEEEEDEFDEEDEEGEEEEQKEEPE